MDDVAVDEVFAFPRRRVENFFQMEESDGDLRIDVGGGVARAGVLGRGFPWERTMGLDKRQETIDAQPVSEQNIESRLRAARGIVLSSVLPGLARRPSLWLFDENRRFMRCDSTGSPWWLNP